MYTLLLIKFRNLAIARAGSTLLAVIILPQNSKLASNGTKPRVRIRRFRNREIHGLRL